MEKIIIDLEKADRELALKAKAIMDYDAKIKLLEKALLEKQGEYSRICQDSDDLIKAKDSLIKRIREIERSHEESMAERKASLISLEQQYSHRGAELTIRKSVLDKKESELSSERDRLKKKEEDLGSDRKSLESRASFFEVDKAEWVRATGEVLGVSAANDSRENELRKYEERLKKEREVLDGKIRDLQTIMESSKVNHGTLLNENKILEQKLKEIEKKNEGLVKKEKEINESLSKLASKESDLSNKESLLKGQQKTVDTLSKELEYKELRLKKALNDKGLQDAIDELKL